MSACAIWTYSRWSMQKLLDDDQLRQAMHGDADQTQATIIKSAALCQGSSLDAITARTR